MFVLTVMSAVPALDEDGGIQEVVEVLSESRHQTIEAAEARLRCEVRGTLTDEVGWVPVGAMEWAREHPGRAILLATIEAEEA